MRKIAIVGPESSGKTTLCEALAQHYRCACTKEYARTYLEGNGPGYTEDDLVRIVDGQALAEVNATQLANDRGDGLILCDTDMITIRIWSEEKFGRCHPLIAKLAQTAKYDLWLLCMPDIPWEPDPLRENPRDRDRLFILYKTVLDDMKRNYVVVSGGRAQRLESATTAIDKLLA